MINLTIFGGVGEIGGNKILIEDNSHRLFLDFGKNFSKESDFFDFPLLQPREEKHLLATGILPNLAGLYKKDPAESKFDGILISHPHTDHWDNIRFVKDDIPIGCLDMCREVIEAKEKSSHLGPSSEYYVCQLTAKGPKVFKTFQTFSAQKDSNFAGIAFEAFEVDHSIPGCVGLILHTSDGNLVYTGDLRFAGPRRDLSLKFMEAARACDPVGLIIEGTNIAEGNISSEAEVKEKANNIVQNATGLVLVGCASADLDRLQTLFEVAKLNDRKIAITMKQAFMIDSLRKAGLPIFDPLDKNVCIFQREKKGLYEYEKEIEKKCSNRITSQDVNGDQAHLLLILGFYEFNELVGVQPKADSVYILSQSEPFNEEMELQFAKLKRWLSLYGIPLYQVHSSGHAKSQELRRFIANVRPKKTILIHTEEPELYKTYISDLNVNPIIPIQGRSIALV